MCVCISEIERETYRYVHIPVHTCLCAFIHVVFLIYYYASVSLQCMFSPNSFLICVILTNLIPSPVLSMLTTELCFIDYPILQNYYCSMDLDILMDHRRLLLALDPGTGRGTEGGLRQIKDR